MHPTETGGIKEDQSGQTGIGVTGKLPIVVIARHEVRAMLRRERRKVRFDAALALVLTLLLGWVYAQLARGIGLERPWIGIVAIAVQALTFIGVMSMRLSEVIWKRKSI